MQQNNDSKKGFAIFNATDGVYFDPRTFGSEADARIAAETRRKRYRRQGYYLTASRERINPDDVELEIVPVNE